MLERDRLNYSITRTDCTQLARRIEDLLAPAILPHVENLSVTLGANREVGALRGVQKPLRRANVCESRRRVKA